MRTLCYGTINTLLAHYETSWDINGTLFGTLLGHDWDIIRQTWNIQTLFRCSITANRYGTLLNIIGTLWDIIGTLLDIMGQTWNIQTLFSCSITASHYGILGHSWDIMRHYWNIIGHY